MPSSGKRTMTAMTDTDEDLLPVDHGKERFETDPAPVKKIIILAVGVLIVIGLCVLMLYFV